MKSGKPLGQKSYGHIPHFPNSRMGEGDHHCTDGQYKIATEKTRDRHDTIIVQEKVDGSNVGIAKLNGDIIPLTRAGYRAETSNFEQHHLFADWVLKPINRKRFDELLNEGERVCGEWLAQAHSTRYDLPHEPLVVFDIMTKMERLPFVQFQERIMKCDFTWPNTVWIGSGMPLSVKEAMNRVKDSRHGAIDEVEGAVWRIERNKIINKQGERKLIVDYLAKYVRPDKVDGIYLPDCSGSEIVWNWKP